MINLLKSDFYKLFRMKSFYVCCIVAVAVGVFGVSINAAFNGIVQSASESMGEAGGMLSNQLITLENFMYSILLPTSEWFILVIIAISLFVTIEYNSGTLKNIVARGFKRENIFFSKMIVCIVESMIIAAVYALSCLILGIIMLGIPSGGFSSGFFTKILAIYGTDILILAGYASLITMIAYIVRSNGGTIAITLCAHYLIPVVIMMFNTTALISSESSESDMEKLFSYSTNQYGDVAYYWIGTLGGTVAESYNNGVIYIPILIALAYIIVTMALGLLVFKKRDIK